ncbi:MAG: hypothetical protein QOH99_1312 [Frankiaceae bacterium]|jgi:L,D-peptidoglycan transpeptidase YkuD (ErfK/YbiS/YcfS/YnhG family)|nr:hypothetical protein [Frankiaceae bacterium]
MSRFVRRVSALATLLIALVVLGFQPVANASTSYKVVPGIGRFVTPAGTSQLIVVRSVSWRSSTATVIAYEKGSTGRWVQKFGPLTAHIGRNGMSVASQRHEGDGTTPAGSFALTTSFGRLANPGTVMPYTKVTSYDYWVGDSASPYYNQMRSTIRGGFSRAQSEHLSAFGPVYDHALVIDFNRPHAVPGRGSAIFLHITNGHTTAGCVAVSRRAVTAFLRWLQPAKHPRIVMGPAAWLAG